MNKDTCIGLSVTVVIDSDFFTLSLVCFLWPRCGLTGVEYSDLHVNSFMPTTKKRLNHGLKNRGLQTLKLSID